MANRPDTVNHIAQLNAVQSLVAKVLSIVVPSICGLHRQELHAFSDAPVCQKRLTLSR
jgi:hypothetical protein